ncbi:MAG: hypothetical protein IJY11_00500 [Clostridia bacterium]|nr:hypothetical protein [Clostridia bacterium]
MEKFSTGLLLGMVAGALVVTNSYKMRVLVKKGQDEMKAKFDEMMDEKIKMIENASPKKDDADEKSAKKAKA